MQKDPRFVKDEQDMEGKTVKKVYDMQGACAFLFEDGTYTQLTAGNGWCSCGCDDDMEISLEKPDGYTLWRLGAITEEEYNTHKAEQDRKRDEHDRAVYEHLKKKFEQQGDKTDG